MIKKIQFAESRNIQRCHSQRSRQEKDKSAFVLLFLNVYIAAAMNDPEYLVGYSYAENSVTVEENGFAGLQQILFRYGGTNMNELRARVISQEKEIYKIQSGTDVKSATVSGKYRYATYTVSDYPGSRRLCDCRVAGR